LSASLVVARLLTVGDPLDWSTIIVVGIVAASLAWAFGLFRGGAPKL
jgi:hypothetical protein